MTGETRNTALGRAWKTAFCGVSAGLSIAIIVMISALTTDTITAPLLAATLLLIVRIECGSSAAWNTWGVVVAVAFMLGLSKKPVIFYLFVGWWPIIKLSLDSSLKHGGIRFLIKTAILTTAITGMYASMFFLIGTQTMATLPIRAVLILATLASMLLYDCLLNMLHGLYIKRIRKVIHNPTRH